MQALQRNMAIYSTRSCRNSSRYASPHAALGITAPLEQSAQHLEDVVQNSNACQHWRKTLPVAAQQPEYQHQDDGAAKQTPRGPG
jgi:hypothetical protein